jgi:hypothetical protein
MGQKKPLPLIKKSFRISKKKKVSNYLKTEGIQVIEVERRKSAGECLRCAWPAERKGTHPFKDCIRPIELDTGTASHPKLKEYLQ